MGRKQIRSGSTRTLAVVLAWAGYCAVAQGANDQIWPRIAAGMELKAPSQPEVIAAAKQYSLHGRQLRKILGRSSPYLWHIVNTVDARNLPMELALLPAIESGFDISARSERRASGLWQFVPATARLYGLHETRHYDPRRDPLASTDAALKYLKKLHDRYGDWLLALAAYNAGEVRVNLEIREAHSHNFWKLRLPQETRAHISRLLGLALVIRQPNRYHLQLPEIPDKPVTDVVVMEQPRDIATAAKKAGVPLSDIKTYNPALKSLSNSGGQHSVLLLPSDAIKLRLELARSDYAPSGITTALIESRQQAAQKHRISAGDNLSVIARRYRISIRQIKTWNHLDENSVLKPGRMLVVASTG